MLANQFLAALSGNDPSLSGYAINQKLRGKSTF
jgi:hypothetical protein